MKEHFKNLVIDFINFDVSYDCGFFLLFIYLIFLCLLLNLLGYYHLTYDFKISKFRMNFVNN